MYHHWRCTSIYRPFSVIKISLLRYLCYNYCLIQTVSKKIDPSSCSRILRDKTMDDKMMLIPNYDKQKTRL